MTLLEFPFWVISMGMLAATAFFFMERNTVAPGWKTSVTVAGLVTGIAFIHYMYMRDVWVTTGDSPTVYRYIDWLITVPLQMIEFYLILVAVRKANSGIFWRLLIGSLVMLIGGYLGEAGYINATLGFVIGMAGWVYILYEIFSGEAGKAASKSGNKASSNCVRCNENDCNCRLGNLPIRLCIWLLNWWRRCKYIKRSLQLS